MFRKDKTNCPLHFVGCCCRCCYITIIIYILNSLREIYTFYLYENLQLYIKLYLQSFYSEFKSHITVGLSTNYLFDLSLYPLCLISRDGVPHLLTPLAINPLVLSKKRYPLFFHFIF